MEVLNFQDVYDLTWEDKLTKKQCIHIIRECCYQLEGPEFNYTEAIEKINEIIKEE